ncbi:SixA phosphatase family protein [Geodermatophilus sabuli]|uniref:Phosphohistidine phosphatase n=1 Tax=Geodermatophilus sabuli TaxID=1564158 RepID=A0A285EG38_9ACTN|nr:histidine phosphatase family protein [Geodermatophilus sabuli]MBB3083092.1 phosphohistidine phosphatase [Geodermatophilus sabuli]SNX98088.1 phosphohistidine phosphatase [Geodermatophilus sabuli]
MSPHRLVLIRHAQAGSAPVDVDRPLTEHGLRQAAAIGSWLGRAGLVPDAVLVSPARRAVQTWERAGVVLVPGLQPVLDARIHDNTVGAVLAAVRETPDEVHTLAVVGHNPAVGQLVTVLDDGQGTPVARQDARNGVPAGGVAVFDLAGPFADLAPGGATLTEFTVPEV